MKQATKRKIYYISVITALLIILVCATIINRTLVNTPNTDISDIPVESVAISEETQAND